MNNFNTKFHNLSSLTQPEGPEEKFDNIRKKISQVSVRVKGEGCKSDIVSNLCYMGLRQREKKKISIQRNDETQNT